MFYCLRPVTGAIVEKTHIPYELSPHKLERIKSQFLGSDWNVTRAQDYGDDQANNPFATFAAIPVKARYQFLLDDAWFHVATFIKGPVCNGSAAVNSIQEQFFVFFLKPEADSMVMSGGARRRGARSSLSCRASGAATSRCCKIFRSSSASSSTGSSTASFVPTASASCAPSGYSLDDIWDGDGTNPNALLTVFRHDDNAAVVEGRGRRSFQDRVRARLPVVRAARLQSGRQFRRVRQRRPSGVDARLHGPDPDGGGRAVPVIPAAVPAPAAAPRLVPGQPAHRRQAQLRLPAEEREPADRHQVPQRDGQQVRVRASARCSNVYLLRCAGRTDPINWRILRVPESAEGAAPLVAAGAGAAAHRFGPRGQG